MKRLTLLLPLVVIVGFASVGSATTVAYWRFDDIGNPVIDNPAGTVAAGNPMPDSDGRTVWREAAHDWSGNGNNLTTWEYSWAGFNWSSDVAAAQVPLTGVANNLSMATTGGCCPAAMTWSAQSLPGGINIETITPAAFTIEVSFKPTYDVANGYHTIVGRDGRDVAIGDGTKAPLYFSTRPGAAVAIEFTDMAGLNHQAVSAAAAIQTGQWYNVVGVSDGSTLSLYLNNILVGQTSFSSTDPRLAIGNGSGADWQAGTWTLARGLWNGGHVDRVYGFIDEVRISDTALDPSQFLSVPEPATMVLLGLGALALAGRRKP